MDKGEWVDTIRTDPDFNFYYDEVMRKGVFTLSFDEIRTGEGRGLADSERPGQGGREVYKNIGRSF